jgi:hypothetical protein
VRQQLGSTKKDLKMAARGSNARKKAKRRRHAKSRKADVAAAAAASQDRAQQPRGR